MVVIGFFQLRQNQDIFSCAATLRAAHHQRNLTDAVRAASENVIRKLHDAITAQIGLMDTVKCWLRGTFGGASEILRSEIELID